MLEIKTESGISLDLTNDIQIDLTIENPFMYADKVPTPYSLSVELPTSARNLMVFGNPHLSTSANIVDSINVVLLFNGITFFEGSLIVDDLHDRAISVTIEGVILSGKYDVPMNSVKMKEYQYTYSDYDEGKIRNIGDLLMRAADGEEPFVAAPVRDVSVKWDIFATEPVWINHKFLLTGRNMFDVTSQSFVHTDHNNKLDLPEITPFVKVSYLFEMLGGGMVDFNPFLEEQFSKIVILPSHKPPLHSTLWSMENIKGTQKYILSISKALSSSPAGDLFKDLLKLLCMSIRVVDGKFNLRYNKDIISDTNVEDWSRKVEDNYSITRIKGETYSWGLKTSGNKDVDSYINVSSAKEMFYWRNAENEELYFRILTTGEIFKRTYVEKEPFFEFILQEHNNENTDAEYNATSDLKIIQCNMEKYSISPRSYFWNPWYIPFIDYSESKENDMYLGVYHGYRPTIEEGKRYPLISAHNYDMMGNKLGDFSLTNKDGVLSSYHSAFAQWLAKPKVKITTRVNLDVNELKMLNVFNKVFCHGKNFYIKTLTMHIKQSKIELTDVELLEA